MMFFILIAIAIVLCAVMLYLPYMSGLTTIEKNKQKSKNQGQNQTKQPSGEYGGYIPPDEDYDGKDQESGFKARASALKERVNVTSSDLPIKIKLQHQQSGVIRNRKEKLDLDTNPNNYDYDLDELIEEESRTASEQQQAEFYKNDVLGQEKEEMV